MTTIQDAARRLVSQFSSVPMSWVKAAAENAGEEWHGEPMWGTAFIVNDSVDRERIKKLLVSTRIEDIESAKNVILAYDIDVDDNNYKNTDGSVNESAFVRAVEREFDENPGGYELIDLAHAGWLAVGTTGVLAKDVDGCLVLGVHGAGYSFYDSHWVPLYEALGYEWHDKKPETQSLIALHAAAEHFPSIKEMKNAMIRTTVTSVRTAGASGQNEISVFVQDDRVASDLRATLDVQATILALSDAIKSLCNGDSSSAEKDTAEALARIALHQR